MDKKYPDPEEIKVKLWTAITLILVDYVKQGNDQEMTAKLIAMLTVKLGSIAVGIMTDPSIAKVAMDAVDKVTEIGLLEGLSMQQRANNPEKKLFSLN